ncbi:hypothetical protein [Rhizobium rhizogenes]|uniref:hypothetical protein n=1 Tax=Rhizobium rhizogenes TaxID=359 RepID=UPI001572A8D3|nr:hypothetical protein [Rhizobium rhizogenes]
MKTRFAPVARRQPVALSVGNIQHGTFYWQDHYPDDHLFADADDLLRRHNPDFLLLHPMSIDDVCHRHGGNSRQYRDATCSPVTCRDGARQAIPLSSPAITA